jgi:hypothetical protein
VFSALDSVWHCRQLSRREEWGAESTFPHQLNFGNWSP